FELGGERTCDVIERRLLGPELPAAGGDQLVNGSRVEEQVLDLADRQKASPAAAYTDDFGPDFIALLVGVEQEQHRDGKRRDRLGHCPYEVKGLLGAARAACGEP